MKKFLLILLVPSLAQAGELKSYRWYPKSWKPLPYLLNAPLDKMAGRKDASAPPAGVALGELGKGQEILPGHGGELIGRGSQYVGTAKVANTWTQTIFSRDGHVIYGAGEVFEDSLNAYLPKIRNMEGSKAEALRRAEELVPDLRSASKKFPVEIEIRKNKVGTFEAYWRIEYLDHYQENLKYIFISDAGTVLETGVHGWNHADGRARVFPKGPRWSSLTEEPLLGLSGDGTLSGSNLTIHSALNLEVRSPDLTFFFPSEDKRFDFAQVYFNLEMGFRWLRERVGVSFTSPLEVKLHIGRNGISNSSFYGRGVVYLGTGDGVIYKDMIKDPSVTVHEAMHAVIDSYAGLPSEDEGGALNEGFADLFSSLVLDNPRIGEASYMGGPYRRTLENDQKAYRDFNKDIYNDGDIMAATFWDMRRRFPNEKIAGLAFRTLVRLGSGGNFQQFVPSLINASTGYLNQEEQDFALSCARNRGWVMVP